MFRGKEAPNRIKLSRLVQELFSCGVFGSLQLWGVGVGGCGWGVVSGEPHTCTHAHACMHVHTCTCMHGKHDNFMQMAAPIGGIPRNSLWCHTCMRVCLHACMCVHVHMCREHPLTTLHPHQPTLPTPGGTRNQSKFNSTWTNRDISILFKRFEICGDFSTHGWVHNLVVWWVGSGQITKNLKIVDWIKIIQLCLKIYDL